MSDGTLNYATCYVATTRTILEEIKKITNEHNIANNSPLWAWSERCWVEIVAVVEMSVYYMGWHSSEHM